MGESAAGALIPPAAALAPWRLALQPVYRICIELVVSAPARPIEKTPVAAL